MTEPPGLFCDSVEMGNLEPIPLSDPVEDQASGVEDCDLFPLPQGGMPLDDHDSVCVYFSLWFLSGWRERALWFREQPSFMLQAGSCDSLSRVADAAVFCSC